MIQLLMSISLVILLLSGSVSKNQNTTRPFGGSGKSCEGGFENRNQKSNSIDPLPDFNEVEHKIKVSGTKGQQNIRTVEYVKSFECSFHIQPFQGWHTITPCTLSFAQDYSHDTVLASGCCPSLLQLFNVSSPILKPSGFVRITQH